MPSTAWVRPKPILTLRFRNLQRTVPALVPGRWRMRPAKGAAGGEFGGFGGFGRFFPAAHAIFVGLALQGRQRLQTCGVRLHSRRRRLARKAAVGQHRVSQNVTVNDGHVRERFGFFVRT